MVGDTNMALYIHLIHLRGKTYLHRERVKQRERYKTRVIRETRLKIYSKVLPPSLLFLSSVAAQKFGQILPARNIYTNTRVGSLLTKAPVVKIRRDRIPRSLFLALSLSFSLFVWSKTMKQNWI